MSTLTDSNYGAFDVRGAFETRGKRILSAFTIVITVVVTLALFGVFTPETSAQSPALISNISD
jgi:hypothetical protein